MKEKIVANVSKVVSKLPAPIRNNGGIITAGLGVGLMVGGTIWACIKTKNVEEVHFEHKENRDTLKECFNAREIAFTDEETSEEVRVPYTKKDYAHDLTVEYAKECFDIFKALVGPVTLELCGAGAIMGSAVWSNHKIGELNGKLAASMVIIDSLNNYINRYRCNVIADQGIEADMKYRMGVVEEVGEVKKVTKNGKEKVIQEIKQVIDDRKIASPYAIPLRFTKVYTDGLDIQYIIDSIKQYQNIAQIHYDASRTNTHGKVLDMMWVYDQLGVTNWLTDYQQVIGKNAGWCEDCSESDQEIIFDVIQDENGETYIDFNCWGGLLLFQQAQCGIFMKPYKTGVR